MRSALYFDDAFDFCDYVRLCGADAKPPNDRGAFELCRVAHPERPGKSALVLFNEQPPARAPLKDAAESIHAEVDLSQQHLYWDFGDGSKTPILSHDFGKTLLEFVEIIEWNETDADEAVNGPVLFWIRGGNDESLAGKLIRDSLRLGNDRIQYAAISADDSASETTSLLLRIERPSYFLVQRCLEEWSDAIELYYPADEALFVRWGHIHPMADRWKQSESGPGNQWIFFRNGADYAHLDPLTWRDAYDLARIVLDFPHRETWTASAETPPHFEVPLRINRRLSPEEPELWLLDEAGVRSLEDTLQITDDETLRAWQIAVQRIANDDTPDREWLFIRETRAGSKRLHHDFAGTGFARYQGLNNLYLPVDRDLQPPLRRDAYRTLFNLEPDTLTIIVPAKNSEKGDFRILRVPENAFDALGSFIDYIVERDAEQLQSLMDQSLFDLRHYLRAPRHPGLAPEQSGDQVSKKAAISDSDLPEKTASTEKAGNRPDSNALLDRLATSGPADESQLNAWEREERRLEREIVAGGQSLDRWSELLVCKNQLGKTADAVLCAIEALWIAAGTEREKDLSTSLVELIDASLDQDPASVTVSNPEWLRRAAVFALTNRRPGSHQALDRWVGEMQALLNEHQDGLRSKERWLAWGAVLAANHDLRRETQLRETIRNRIVERGLGLEETPSFIRSRIFLDREFFGDAGAGDSDQTAAESALTNLHGLRTRGESFESPRLRLAFRAVLARAFANLGEVAQARELIDRSSSSTGKDGCAQAWEALFHIEALRKIEDSRAAALEPRLAGLLKQAEPDTARAVRELRESYEKRALADNPAAFLARENRGRTYPRGAATETGQLYELSIQLEEQVAAGNEPGAVQVMRAMMTLEDTDEYDDSIKLPQFVETLVAGLERFKWGERGATLIPLFENFAEAAPSLVSQKSNDFYGAILHSNLALGLLTVENLERALRQLEQATEVTGRNTIELDFIDAASAVIRVVEQLPLGQRAPFLERLLGFFADHFDSAQSQYVSNERLFAVLAKLLDQMAEAASSKDRLSLEQFRQYQLQDEFLILQRIQSETFSEETKTP